MVEQRIVLVHGRQGRAEWNNAEKGIIVIEKVHDE